MGQADNKVESTASHVLQDLLLEKKLHWVMLYHFEVPRSRGFQKCKNENQRTPSCEVSDPQFLGHKIKSYPFLTILVPNNTHGTLNTPTKY